MIKAYDGGKEKKILNCYGIKDKADATTQKEIDGTLKYFEAHDAKGIEIVKCDNHKKIREVFTGLRIL